MQRMHCANTASQRQHDHETNSSNQELLVTDVEDPFRRMHTLLLSYI